MGTNEEVCNTEIALKIIFTSTNILIIEEKINLQNIRGRIFWIENIIHSAVN
jgi:hypothetical protein